MFDVPERPAHSMRGGSSAYRYTKCHGSINLINKLGWRANYTSEAAAEGTVAHEFASELLEAGDDAWTRAGETKTHKIYEFEFDPEMMMGVQLHLDTCHGMLKKYPDATMLVEHPMQSILDDEAYGTADCIIYVPGDRIIVIDFKYGQGIVVEPDAMQLKYYGYLAYETRPDFMKGDGEPKEIELWVVQPRIPHGQGLCRSYNTTPEALTDFFTGEIIPAMEATRDPLAPLTVGDHCIFCPAKRTGTCPALQTEVFEYNIDLEPNHLSDGELGEALSKKGAITKFLEDLELVALNRARQGNRIPGRKLVKKTGNRLFRDDMEVVDEDTGDKVKLDRKEEQKRLFGTQAFTTPELRSPAQLDKLPGGKQFTNQWCFSPDKGTKLVSRDDKGIEIVVSGEALFGDIELPEDIGSDK